ncbi:MAG: hypothetical protein LBR80_07730, partial [Deltaproteobacteria bacterium]|nr:hypothetical protein [Deltaproteobacteria bacterium]
LPRRCSASRTSPLLLRLLDVPASAFTGCVDAALAEYVLALSKTQDSSCLDKARLGIFFSKSAFSKAP